MKNKFWIIFVTSLLLLAILLPACAKSTSTTTTPVVSAPTTPASTTAAAPQPTTPKATTPAPASTTPATQKQYGGNVKAINAVGFAPTTSIGWPAELTRLPYTNTFPCLQSLLREDGQGNPQPLLATAWSVAPDGKSITLTLRQGVQFHDGTNFDAQAAKFNLDAQIAAKQGGTEQWSSVDIIDNNTIRLNVKSFQNTIFEHLAVIPGLMVSPTAYQKNGLEWMRLNMVGTGPFVFQSFQRDVNMTFKKNTNYWEKGKPYLDSYEWLYIANETTASMNMQSGAADILFMRNAKIVSDLQNAGFVPTYYGDTQPSWWPDSAVSTSPFSKLEVRQALEYAIDKESIAKTLGYGFWKAMYQPAVPTNAAYIPNLTPRTYNPDKAKQLLTEAGFPQGFETTLIASPDADRNALSSVQGFLKAVGINATIKDVQMADKMQMMVNGWNGLFYGPVTSFTNFNRSLESNFVSASSAPTTKAVIHPPGLEEAIKDSLSSSTMDQQKIQKAVKIWYDAALNIPLYAYTVGIITTKNIHDHHFLELASQLWTPEDMWMSK